MTKAKILNLEQARERIDTIDQEIQALIAERASAVLEVGRLKREEQGEPVFYRPEREAIILKRVMKRDCAPLSEEEMAKVFRTIMSACLALQQPMNIAFLGPEGTFSEQATIKHFGQSTNLMPVNSINDVFEKVESKAADYGVVPIENSIGGVVNEAMDSFIDSNLQICGEVDIPIHQNLLVNSENSNRIERIYSHEQSLAQCRKWLSKNYPHVEQVAVSSNAYAAQLAAKDKNAAAIAGEAAAEKYQLKMLATNIEDEPNNITRFLVVCHQSPPPSDDDRTSMLVSINNMPGALEKLIKPFSKNDINLTLIKSRPSLKEKGTYIFFLDIDAHQDDPSFETTLKELKEEPVLIKILGSYPKAVL